jgi:ribosomal protein S18 acetylase RimI-like enzyme
MTDDSVEFRAVTAAHAAAVREFVAGIGATDLTVLDDQLLDPERLAAWVADPHAAGLLALTGGRVSALGSVRPGTGWSGHVAGLRLVVAVADRGRGVGARLCDRLIRLAAERGVTKVVVEVMAANTGVLGWFERLGFTPEATLRDHVRDGRGHHHDLVVLAHWIDRRGDPIDRDTELAG